MSKKALIMYVPNFHAGYIQLINDVHPDTIVLLDESIMSHLVLNNKKQRTYLDRSFPYAINPYQMKRVIETFRFGYPLTVQVLGAASDNYIHEQLLDLSRDTPTFVMPEEDVSHYFYDDYLKPLGITCEFSDKVFLRYNKRNAEAGKQPFGETIIFDHLDEPLLGIVKLAAKEADKSDDWWRQVAAVLFDEASGEILLAGYNKHMPDGHHRYAYGDARSSFGAGYKPELVTAIHAEQNIFMQALQRGISTKGKSLYVSTYPCPYCSNMIALSGIKKLYYTEGYSVMDEGRSLFKTMGIEVAWLHPDAMKKATT